MKYFTVIIPVYNVKQYLRECIESVLNQTCKDYEILLIDDGSTDGSEKICDEYAAKSPYVKVLHQKNQGQSAARNQGIEMAEGKYILFLDSDDYWYDKNCLNGLLQYVSEENPGVDIVTYQAVYTTETEDERQKNYKRINYLQESESKEGYTAEEFLIKHIKNNRFYDWAPWHYAISKDIFMDKKLRFPMNRKYEDVYLMWRILVKADRIGVIPNVFYVYRKMRQGATTFTPSYKYYHDFLWAVDQGIKDIKKMDLSDELKHTLLCAFSMNYVVCCVRISDLAPKEKEKMLLELEEKKSYLQYADTWQYKMVRDGEKILGFRNVVRILQIYFKGRSRLKNGKKKKPVSTI